MRKRSGQVHSRESSATLQLTVSLLYLFGNLNLPSPDTGATMRAIEDIYVMNQSIMQKGEVP